MRCGLRYDEDNRLLPLDAEHPADPYDGLVRVPIHRNPCRRPGERRDPALNVESWIPACAGMTMMMRSERYSECISVVVSNKPQAVHQRFGPSSAGRIPSQRNACHRPAGREGLIPE
jgi:hypothetical protein